VSLFAHRQYRWAFSRKAEGDYSHFFLVLARWKIACAAVFGKENAMRIFKLLAVVLVLLGGVKLVLSSTEPEVQPTPVMRTVSPETVKAGEIATVSGEYLDKSRVGDLFLTNAQGDIKVQILEQSASAIKFRVPAKAAPGRYNLLVLLVDIEPKLIEEPARLTVE